MVHHYRFNITGDVRARFLKYLCAAVYAGCARVVDCGDLDWASCEEAEVLPHTHLTLDVATPSEQDAVRIADRIGQGLCLGRYELACVGKDEEAASRRNRELWL